MLREEMRQFLVDAKSDIRSKFSDVRFLICLSFLVEIFESMNSLNWPLQGKEMRSSLHCDADALSAGRSIVMIKRLPSK